MLRQISSAWRDIEETGKHFAWQFSNFAGKRTALSEVAALIEKLRPQPTGHELIRIGGPGDGGYLVPDDLDGISRCFSPGVSNMASFECDLARRGVVSCLADASVEGPPPGAEDFVFDRKFVGCVNVDPFMTLDAWVAARAPEDDRDMLLQMDIEGSEYTALAAVSQDTLSRFRIVVLEMHGLDGLFNRDAFPIFRDVSDKLMQFFVVAHIHPNNHRSRVVRGSIAVPPIMEFTFLRRDRVRERAQTPLVFPHPQDAPNNPWIRDVILPRIWRPNGGAA